LTSIELREDREACRFPRLIPPYIECQNRFFLERKVKFFEESWGATKTSIPKPQLRVLLGGICGFLVQSKSTQKRKKLEQQSRNPF
jgi:hypothetical protein